MLPTWLTFVVFCTVIALMTAAAVRGERDTAFGESPIRRRLTYALAVCVFCSGTNFGNAIAMASRRGLDFLPIFLGPIILFGLFYPVVVRIARLSKGQNFTSIIDFVAARYGRSTSVAVMMALVVTIGTIPFIAMQLKSITHALSICIEGSLTDRMPGSALAVTTGVALVLAVLTIAIGRRGLAASETNRGLMLALATGSAIKVMCILLVGSIICWRMFKGLGDLTARVAGDPTITAAIDATPTPAHWMSAVLFSFALSLVLPFAFYIGVVGNRQESDVRTAAWVVPVYVLALSLMIMPVAAAGLAMFPTATFDRQFTVFALTIHAHDPTAALVALFGTISSGTVTTLAATTSLAIIVANDLVMPIYLRVGPRPERAAQRTTPILIIRRLAIVGIFAAAYACAICLTGWTISSLAFVFLVCAVQIAPAAIGGLLWDRGTSRGALAGCTAGVVVWGYTLLLPTVSVATSPLLANGPLGFDALRPTDLFSIDMAPFDQGVFWSLSINVLVYVGMSLTRRPNANERLQASVYVHNRPVTIMSSLRLRRVGVETGDLIAATALYIGKENADSLFSAFHASRDLILDRSQTADAQLLKYAEALITSTIGAASSRTAISNLIERRSPATATALRIMDDVALEVHSSHDVLQHAIDIARDGMAVFDGDLRLVAWNRAYRDMFQLPAELMRIGTPLDSLVRSNAERGIYGVGSMEMFVAARLEMLTRPTDSLRLHGAPFDRVLEMHSVRLNNGGLFFTYADATAQVRSEADLEAENVTLEHRVRERTEDLETLNFELARAKAEAEDANVSKTRFLAAASHDLLQPLNAARLYTTSLRERLRAGPTSEDTNMLATHIDTSLEAVEDIIGALLEISHLDAGATKTEIANLPLEAILRQLEIEFVPLAKAQGLRLRIGHTSAWVKSDRRLLSRLLQNFISNAIKYTMDGGVVVGVRRSGSNVRIEVHDTGLGIPESKQVLIFREFERLAPAVRVASGAGLGLSIVERLGRVLKHDIDVRSQIDRGSIFSVTMPMAEASAVGPGSAAVGAVTKQRSLEGLVVAAIDNERHILNGMEILLQGWDCVVATGTCLEEIDASLVTLETVPDVILADFHIDEIDGLDVIASLRTRFGSCPAVLITADRDPEIRARAYAADVRVLNKPLKPAALRALLSQWRLVKVAAE